MNITNFVVQVWPVAQSGIARICNEITFFYEVAIFYIELIQVAVTCLETKIMPDKQQFAVATLFLAHGILNNPICRSINRSIHLCSQIDTVMMDPFFDNRMHTHTVLTSGLHFPKGGTIRNVLQQQKLLRQCDICVLNPLLDIHILLGL